MSILGYVWTLGVGGIGQNMVPSLKELIVYGGRHLNN